MLQSILSAIPADNPWREQIQYFDNITSTNDVLKQLAAQGAPEGTTLIAGCQTNGKGRLGRQFLSPPETGIYLSVLLRPQCHPTDLMHLTCAAGSAACDAIQTAANFCPSIKWANDIVFQKRKLAGILVEMVIGEARELDCAIIGIGINCNQEPTDFPESIRDFAGSIKMATGKSIEQALVAAATVNSFYELNRTLLTQKDAILEAYRRKCITIGQHVSVVRGDTVRHGLALDVDEQAALVVQYDGGETEHVSSGEVSVRGLYNYV